MFINYFHMFINISCLRISQNVKDVTVKDVKGMTFGPLILRKDENISRILDLC